MFDFTMTPVSEFDLLPDGLYHAFIEEPAWQTTKAGTGEYLKLTFVVKGDKYAGRKVWTNLNLVNPNQKAVEIAFKEMVSILTALGYKQEELSNVEKHQILEYIDQKELMIKVATKKDDTYGDRNVIKGYKPAKAQTEAPKDDIGW